MQRLFNLFNNAVYRVAEMIPGNHFSRAVQTYYGPPPGDTSDPASSDILSILLICVAPIACLLVIAVGVGAFFLGKKNARNSSKVKHDEKKKENSESKK